MAQVVILLLSFRLLIFRHGPAAADHWLALVAIVNLGALCELGHSNSLIQQRARHLGTERIDFDITSSAAQFYLIFFSMVATFLCAAIFFSFFVKADLGTHPIFFSFICAILSCGLLGSNRLIALLKSDLRFAAAGGVAMLQQTSLFLIPAATGTTSNLEEMALWSTGALISMTLAGHLLFSYLLPRPRRLTLSFVVSQFRSAAPYGAQNALSFGYSHLLRLLLIQIGSPGETAAMAACQSILGKAQGIASAATEAMNPAVAKGMIQPSIYVRALVSSQCLAVALLLLLLPIAQFLLPFILSQSLGQVANRILPILAVGYGLAAGSAVAVNILNGLNRPWGNALIGLAGMISSLLLLAILLPFKVGNLEAVAYSISLGYSLYAFAIASYGYYHTTRKYLSQ